MPEGDTIHRLAHRLDSALAGRPLRGLEFDGQAHPVDDCEVAGVEARGKYLWIRFDDGRSLCSHLRMKGRWFLRSAKPGRANAGRAGGGGANQTRPSPPGRTRVVIQTDAWVAFCVDAPYVELLKPGRTPEPIRRLGPDLVDPGVDLAAASARLRSRPSIEIGEALMLQQLVAGIGNVYKSEVLFLTRVSPFLKVGELPPEALSTLLQKAHRLLRRNLRAGPRQTRQRTGGGGRLWVYRRRGEDCYKCGAVIEMRRQVRSTYYCPSCQAVA